jgi:predicted amidophosphoribosyltransferase
MSKICQIDYNNSLITKTRNTKPQSHLSKIQRIENLQNAFKININELKKYKNKTIVIVDDVIST